MPLHRLHPDFRIREGRGGVGRMLNKNTSGTTGGKGEVPSQGTGPISPLFSRAQFLVCFGASQQDSSGYSLAKEGRSRHQVNGPVPLEAAAGHERSECEPDRAKQGRVVRSTSDNRWLTDYPVCARYGGFA